MLVNQRRVRCARLEHGDMINYRRGAIPLHGNAGARRRGVHRVHRFRLDTRIPEALALSSDLADATVVHQIRTRHVGTLVGRQEERRAGNLLGSSESTDRDHAQVHVHQILALRR